MKRNRRRASEAQPAPVAAPAPMAQPAPVAMPTPMPYPAPTAEVAEEKKLMVNCPKCSTALFVKSGNYAHLCPVCAQVFRIRLGEKLVKDLTRKTMVEAFVTIDKSDKGGVQTNSIVNRVE